MTGLLVRERLPPALAAAIERVLDDPDAAARAGARGARARRGALLAREVDRPAARTLRRAARVSPEPAADRAAPGGQPLVDGQRGAGDPPADRAASARAPGAARPHRGRSLRAEGARGGPRAPAGLSLEVRGDPVLASRDLRRVRAMVRAEGVDVIHVHHSHDHWLGWLGRGPAGPRAHLPQCARGAPRPGSSAAGSTGAPTPLLAVSGRDRGARPARRASRPSRLARVDGVVDLGALRGRRRAPPSARSSTWASAAGASGCVARLAPPPRPRAADPRLPALLAASTRTRGCSSSARARRGRAWRRSSATSASRARCSSPAIATRISPRVLQALDAFVLLGAGSDESCRAALEAMAAGRPVVARRVGALPETVVHGVTGLLVDDERPESVEAALRWPRWRRSRRRGARRMGRAPGAVERCASAFGSGAAPTRSGGRRSGCPGPARRARERGAMKILQIVSCRGWSSDAYWAARVSVELERAGHDVTLVCKRGSRGPRHRAARGRRASAGSRPWPWRAASSRSATPPTCGGSSSGSPEATWSTSIAARSTGWPPSPTACRTPRPLVRTRHIVQPVRPHALNRWLYGTGHRAGRHGDRGHPPPDSGRRPRSRARWWRCRAASTPSGSARPRRGPASARRAWAAARRPAHRPRRRASGS